MNRFVSLAVGVAVLLIMAYSPQPTYAQIFGEFGQTTVLNNMPYQEITGTGKNVVTRDKFVYPPNMAVTNTQKGYDDGYFLVSLPFDYEYNGEIYNTLWICVNGFVMFPEKDLSSGVIKNPPNSLIMKNPEAYTPPFRYSSWFFNYSTSFPMNIVAPFMGDHYYRYGDDNPDPSAPKQYMPSEISYQFKDSCFTVQWKNININYDDPTGGLLGTESAGITSSVANFQVKIYMSKDPYTKQGDIEFCYGPAGGNLATSETNVVTRNAAIGIKGNSEVENEKSDFLNGLYNVKSWIPLKDQVYNQDSARLVTSITSAWPPTGGTDYRFHFYALGRKQKGEQWGDGDVNLSSLEGSKHGYPGMGQSRNVTVADARAIMRSVVLNQPLPRERRREAYHGDVNHNGRYFYYADNNYWDTLTSTFISKVFRKDILWQNKNFSDSLAYIEHVKWNPVAKKFDAVIVPSNIKSIAQVYYQVTENDAALILNYISGRVPYLPFLVDTVIHKGKAGLDDVANGLVAGTVKSLGNGTYSVPLYLNGKIDGAVSVKADVSASIATMSAYADDNNTTMADFNDKTIVVAGSGSYNQEQPLMNLIVKSDKNQLTVSNIRFNDAQINPININLTTEETVTGTASIGPNPFTTATNLLVNIPENGFYSVKVYDMLGKCVKVLSSTDLNKGYNQFTWDGTDANGNQMNSGSYIIRVNGNNVNTASTVVLAR